MQRTSRIHSTTGRRTGVWPVLLALVAAAVIPAGCVLWFMTLAMRNEALAARQRLGELYQQQLTAAQGRIQQHWTAQADKLAQLSGTPPQLFHAAVLTRLADAVLIVGAHGELRYPILALPQDSVDRPAQWDIAAQEEMQGHYAVAAGLYAGTASSDDPRIAAIALRDQGRCLARSGNAQDAANALSGLARPELLMQRDEQGRLIAIDGLAYAASLGRPELLKTVADVVTDYRVEMLSSQRILLLRAAGEAALAQAEIDALTAAESRRYSNSIPQGTLHHLTGSLWTLDAGNGRFAIYRDATLRQQTLNAAADELLAGARIMLTRDGEQTAGHTPIAAMRLGEWMPGWTLSAELVGDDPLAAASRRERLAYGWTAAAGLAAIALGTGAMGLYLRRQLHLTQLKSDLIATVSHELKTPLASSRLLIETLLEGRTTGPQQQREYLELIAKENARLSRLIDNFLSFSRMERNRRAFDFKPIRPEGFICPAVGAVRERFIPPGAILKITLAPKLPSVTADREAMETVILNLLDNAWKYTLDEKRVELRVSTAGDALLIEVQDNGIGLTARQAARVFDRFYQADVTLSRRVGGCGLGLSIVKFIVESHGGTVSVSSDTGVGSVFRVRLPLERK